MNTYLTMSKWRLVVIRPDAGPMCIWQHTKTLDDHKWEFQVEENTEARRWTHAVKFLSSDHVDHKVGLRWNNQFLTVFVMCFYLPI